ncbi:MAG TPA: ATP-binding protein, partial [Desulfatiglandales bacterium]
REKIERILTNLLGNALKFTPEGGEISVLARRSGEEERMVAVSIKDSGVGIPLDQLDKIFEKFHQVENSLHRSVSGTGLGLAITKGLVEAHHGRIWVESEVEKGSTFTFTLPEAGGEMKDFHFRLILDTEFRKAQKNSTPLSLFVMEISNEAEVQDEILLEQLEQKVKGCLCRNTDITVRQENENFLASLCEADVKGAQVIRHRIEETAIKELVEASGGSFDIKIGSASYPEEAVSGQELLSMARERLRR